ncbi:ubiquitin-like-conjugating enzyme ATG10 isoform X2 [Tasmannia lanceolata]|uniref:ubiquitin-like-conjugating enzyme ATG10 isoform X2 n=1 Tax=Tasmannia lanceolata TaxID=3420 RepID=UPI004062FB75
MQNSWAWDGTLSSDDFVVAARALSKRWKDINPNLPSWSWIPCPRLPWVASHKEHHTEESFSGEEDLIDKATLVQSHDQEAHIYDFHIVYSPSYRVPVLYCRGYRCDGHPLEFEDIKKQLSLHSSRMLKEAEWTFMTQEEHPYLNRPWFTLHPCGTSDWMKLLFLGHTTPIKDVIINQYLISWLSVVGQAVGLRITLEMLNKSPQLSGLATSISSVIDG